MRFGPPLDLECYYAAEDTKATAEAIIRLRDAQYCPPTRRGGDVAEEISSLRTALERSLRDLGLQKRLKTEQLTRAVAARSLVLAVAKIAYPAQFRSGTLFIDVTDSVWMQELKFQEGELIGRLNDALGEALVRRLFFQLARIPATRAPTHRRESKRAACQQWGHLTRARAGTSDARWRACAIHN